MNGIPQSIPRCERFIRGTETSLIIYAITSLSESCSATRSKKRGQREVRIPLRILSVGNGSSTARWAAKGTCFSRHVIHDADRPGDTQRANKKKAQKMVPLYSCDMLGNFCFGTLTTTSWEPVGKMPHLPGES